MGTTTSPPATSSDDTSGTLEGTEVTTAGPTSSTGAEDSSTDTGGSTGASTGSDSSTGEPGVAPTFETVREVARVLCAVTDCHNKSTFPLLVDDEALYQNLLTQVSQRCNNLPLITPGNPDASALVQVITGPCGAVPRMPYLCVDNCVPPDYVAAIEQWVLDGALQ